METVCLHVPMSTVYVHFLLMVVMLSERSTTTVPPSSVQLLVWSLDYIHMYMHCMNTFDMYFITVLLITLYTTIVDYISLVNSISLCGSSAVSVAKLCSVMDT